MLARAVVFYEGMNMRTQRTSNCFLLAMGYTVFMIIKEKNVILRPITLGDAERFVLWFNDPEVNKFLHRRSMTLEQEREWIKASPEKRQEVNFAIDTSGGVHIGSVGLRNIDEVYHYADFGIMIGDKNYWNKGLGSEATNLMLCYGFEQLHLHRIELDVYEYNERAIKVYERIGFIKEGVKREHVLWDGKFYDTILMGMLASEWENKKTRKGFS